MKPNILVITLDDMNYDSAGFLGNHNITPNIDKLAREGLYFDNAHVTVSVCQPSRQCLMTGKYPHNNGSHGFTPIMPWVDTLQEYLSDLGYYNGIISKIDHLQPNPKYCWDYIKDLYYKRHHWGRIPTDYYESAKEFFAKVDAFNQPFFLMANSHDPHRPFTGSQQEKEMFGFNTTASKTFNPEEINVPGFLPDIPKIRQEVAEYFTSVHRADESVAYILKALEESGYANDTIVIFLSDNGMAFPYAKTNCYLNSTKTPFIVRWPDVVPAGIKDSSHCISGVDLMPTLLDILGCKYNPTEFDGNSFKNILFNQEDTISRDRVFTLFNATAAHKNFEMRCVQTPKYGYIYNEWADGNRNFANESMTGLSFNAMKEAASVNPNIKDRVDFFLYRTPEEFYDLENDPNSLKNLINDPTYQPVIQEMKTSLLEDMKRSKDPLYDSFKKICV